MTLVTDHTTKMYRHIDELEDLGLVTENQAGRLRDRLNALEGDLQEAYENDPDEVV